MTKENASVPPLLEFLLGLFEVCIAIALLAGTVVASTFLAIQGTFVIRDKYGPQGVAIELTILFWALILIGGLYGLNREMCEQDRTRRARGEAHTENDQQGPKDENETYERCTSDKARSVEVCSS